MSEIVANLDAALADYRARNAGTERSIVIFGREWLLVPELTTTTANALASVVQYASDAEGIEDTNQAIHALMAVADVLPSVIDPSVRAEFRKAWIETGVPLGALEVIVEAVMESYNPAPFSQAVATAASEVATPAPSSGSGSSPMPSGPTSNPPLPSVPTPSLPVQEVTQVAP